MCCFDPSLDKTLISPVSNGGIFYMDHHGSWRKTLSWSNTSKLLLLALVESEPLLGRSFHLLSDLLHCFASKCLFILLCSNDLLRECTELFNVLAAIDFSEGCFQVKPLLN